MSKGKHIGTVRTGSKVLIAVLAISLALCTVIGGTVAWLIASTDPVVNTFTYGDINITIEETDTKEDNDNDPNTNTYPMIPGNTITKDPKVTVLANSEDAYLFVKLVKSTDPAFDEFMSYEMADGWTLVPGQTDVYYREVAKAEDDVVYTVIKEDKVTVSGDVTKEMLNELDEKGYPTLTITAYAVQRDAEIEAIDTVEEAWALAEPQN